MKKKFDLTEKFTTPEILNKYRHTDKNVDKKIKEKEIIKEKYENLDKMINKSMDKIKENSVKNITNNYYSNVNDEIEDDRYMEYINENIDGVDIADLYEQEYNFDNDDSILESFQKYIKHNIKYKPQNNTKFIRVRYLLKN